MTVAAAGVGVATLPSAGEARSRGAAGPVRAREFVQHSAREIREDTAGVATAPVEGAGAQVLRLAHGRLTLDELVSGAWAALQSGFPAACPVCASPMTASEGQPARCRGCHSELS